MQLHCL